MCGIAGVFKVEVTEKELRNMASRLRHRGPDSEGVYLFDNFGLAHTRLSIVDLTTDANQPFISSCGNYSMVFNGEIYNFKELASKHNLTLRTKSDTEVLLELFIQRGTKMVNELNGMFSFVILDKRKKELFVCRDRLGVKPLFYYWDGKCFAFASEIKALLALPEINKGLSVCNEAVQCFLHLGYIPHPYTIYNSIHKFPSGSYAYFDRENLSFSKYWNQEEAMCEPLLINEEEAAEKLEVLLYDSIKLRMFSDVPYGAFLSGGIDSSLVAAIASKLSSAKLNTFSLGFKESSFNEAGYAKQIADFLGTNHEEITLSEEEAIKYFSLVIDNFDEPYADSSSLPSYIVSLLSRNKVKMVLTGDGGDELFMGYGSYTWMSRLENYWVNRLANPLSLLMRTFGTSRIKRVGELLKLPSETGELFSHVFSQEQYFFSRTQVGALLKNNDSSQLDFLNQNNKSLKSGRKLSLKGIQSVFDLNYYLQDDLLVKVDRTSMLASIEAREPLLDYRIVELSLRIDDKLKIKDSTNKYLLKKVLYKHIPEKYFNRPKWGFSIPLDKWMKNNFDGQINEVLSRENLIKTNFLNCEEVQHYLERYKSGKEDYLYNRIWALFILNRWVLNNGINK